MSGRGLSCRGLSGRFFCLSSRSLCSGGLNHRRFSGWLLNSCMKKDVHFYETNYMYSVIMNKRVKFVMRPNRSRKYILYKCHNYICNKKFILVLRSIHISLTYCRM